MLIPSSFNECMHLYVRKTECGRVKKRQKCGELNNNGKPTNNNAHDAIPFGFLAFIKSISFALSISCSIRALFIYFQLIYLSSFHILSSRFILIFFAFIVLLYACLSLLIDVLSLFPWCAAYYFDFTCRWFHPRLRYHTYDWCEFVNFSIKSWRIHA